MLILGMTMICLKFLQSPHGPVSAQLSGGALSFHSPPMPRLGHHREWKGIPVNPRGDVQKTGMEDVASRPRFRTAQRQGAELLQ